MRLGDQRHADIRRDIAVAPRQTSAESLRRSILAFAHAPTKRVAEHATVTFQGQAALTRNAFAHNQRLVCEVCLFGKAMLALFAMACRQARSQRLALSRLGIHRMYVVLQFRSLVLHIFQVRVNPAPAISFQSSLAFPTS